MSYWNRLAQYRKQGPKALEKPFALLPRDAFEDAIGSALSRQLEIADFQRKGKSAWMRSMGPDITGRVELRPLKSEATSAVWGVRLRFVPRLEKLTGRRWWSGEQGSLDLSYDPLNYEPDPTEWCLSRFSTPTELAVDAPMFAAHVTTAAKTFIDPLTDLMRVRAAFERKRLRKGIRFGFDEYPQEVFAYAFLLARLSETDSAVASLTRLVELDELPADQLGGLTAQLANIASSR